MRREACSWRSHTTASFPWALILTIYIHAYGASLLPRHLLTNCPCLGRVSRYVPFEDFIPEEQAFTALPFPYRMNFTLGKKMVLSRVELALRTFHFSFSLLSFTCSTRLVWCNKRMKREGNFLEFSPFCSFCSLGMAVRKRDFDFEVGKETSQLSLGAFR